MGAPVNDSYAITGGGVVAGRNLPRGIASAVEVAIAGMSSNSLMQYTGTNINEMETSNYEGEANGILESVANYPMTNWCGKGTFDPVRKVLSVVGTAQGFSSYTPAGERSKAVYFDLATNSFSVKWNPTGKNEGHIYDGNVSRQMGGYVYRRSFNNSTVWKMDTDTKTWSLAFDSYLFMSPVDQIVSIEVFPDLGTTGSLILLAASGKLCRYDFSTATGSTIGTYSGISNYPSIIYLANDQQILFGCGETGSSLYVLSKLGAVTSLTTTLPSTVFVSANTGGCVPHPDGSSNILVFSTAANTIWSLNVNTGTWTSKLAITGSISGAMATTICTSLLGMGAVALMRGVGRSAGVTQSTFFIYKV